MAPFPILPGGLVTFSHWYDLMPVKRQCKGGRAWFGSWFEGRVCQQGDSITSVFVVWSMRQPAHVSLNKDEVLHNPPSP